MIFKHHQILKKKKKKAMLNFQVGGGHIYLLSPVLFTLHSAAPLGQVAPQM